MALLVVYHKVRDYAAWPPAYDAHETAEAVPIGAQGRAKHQGIPSVVFGASGRETVAEAIELLGGDRVDGDPAIHRRLDHQAVRYLDV